MSGGNVLNVAVTSSICLLIFRKTDDAHTFLIFVRQNKDSYFLLVSVPQSEKFNEMT